MSCFNTLGGGRMGRELRARFPHLSILQGPCMASPSNAPNFPHTINVKRHESNDLLADGRNTGRVPN